MPRSLSVAPHLSLPELDQRSRTAPVRDRQRWRAVYLVATGHPATVVGPTLGCSPEWVRCLVHRYNQHGAAGLADHRVHNVGAMPMLNEAVQTDLRTALARPAPGGGLWTGPAVAAWMAERLGRPVHPQRGWDYLRRLGFRPQHPRPHETRADAEAHTACKKGGSPPS